MNIPKKLKMYANWGINFIEVSGENWTAICPFCKNEGSSRENVPRFGVNVNTGAFNCFFCGKGGSWRDFLKNIYQFYYEQTTEQDLKYLMGMEGIPLPALKKFRVAKYELRYFVPYFNADLEVSDLKYWRYKRKENSTDGAIVGIFNLPNIKNTENTIYICGSWRDAISLDWLLTRTNRKGVVCATSGENTFRDEFILLFENKNIVIVFDNDEAGYGNIDSISGKVSGGKKVWVKLKDVAKSVKYVLWPKDKKEGYDIKDYINEYKAEPYKAIETFETYIQPFDSSPERLVKPKVFTGSRLAFGNIIEECKKIYQVDSEFETVIKVAMSTVLSVRIPGRDKVWMFLVGGSGSGKSVACDIFQQAKQYTLWESSIGKTALISGFGMGRGIDPSILNRVNNKCLIVNDFTTVLEKSESERKEIFSILRDAYLGFVKRPFGFGDRTYNSSFSFLAGVTAKINEFNSTPVGERFLRYKMPKSLDDNFVVKALDAQLFGTPQLDVLKQTTNKYLEQEFDIDPISLKTKIPNWFRERLIPLSKLCAHIRTAVTRHEKGLKFGNLTYEPVKEEGSRIAVQLEKLALGLCLIDEKIIIDEEIYDICKKTAIDTVSGFEFKILKFLCEENNKFTMKELNEQLHIDGILNYLKDMEVLNLIEKNGSQPAVFSVIKSVRDFWNRAKL